MKEGRFSAITQIIFFIFISANLVALNLWVWKSRPSDKAAMVAQEAGESRIESNCDKECQQKIYQAIAESTQSAKLSLTNSPTPTTSAKTTATYAKGKEVKEVYALGSGSSNAGDWTDVAGMQVFIDTTKYKNVKQAIFEATIRIPTGNEVAYARLFNVTDNDPAWGSEISVEGGTAELVNSGPIFLGIGNKLYQVQMKTSLKHTAFIDQARVRMTAEQ
ncbi:MAG: hypothetical protein HYT11_02595 [Candidatus Levybacteria bacterium]|nr:hypothetical protein [Candidatus Levybacteria bacterium]